MYEKSEFEEKVIQVNRVSKKTKGGNKVGFSVLVAVGNHSGKVGVGLGKSGDVSSAVKKGFSRAKKSLVEVQLVKDSLPRAIRIKKGAAKIFLKPAPVGAGLIAGGPIRIVLGLAGIKNVSAKILGTNNRASNVYAVMEALRQLSLK